MRKDIPFIETVPLDSGIAVLNTHKWYLDKLQISVVYPDNRKQVGTFNQYGEWVVGGLENGCNYKIEISRTDLKGRILYRTYVTTLQPIAGGSDYYVLVGASVGRDWHFERLPRKLDFANNAIFGFRARYQFDKTEDIRTLVNLSIPVKGIIIKECAAYFPRDIEESKQQIIGWVDLIKGKGIEPILATVVPVTAAHSKNNPGQLEGILAFNDFIREYAGRKSLQVLDLEKAVRISDLDRSLRPDFARDDGLHLSPAGYESGLDKAISVLNLKCIDKE